MSTNRRMDKQNAVRTPSGILFSHRRKKVCSWRGHCFHPPKPSSDATSVRALVTLARGVSGFFFLPPNTLTSKIYIHTLVFKKLYCYNEYFPDTVLGHWSSWSFSSLLYSSLGNKNVNPSWKVFLLLTLVFSAAHTIGGVSNMHYLHEGELAPLLQGDCRGFH